MTWKNKSFFGHKNKLMGKKKLSHEKCIMCIKSYVKINYKWGKSHLNEWIISGLGGGLKPHALHVNTTTRKMCES